MAKTGNKVYQNFGLNPATNFNFILRVEGAFDLPCKSVHVFQKENEYEYIQEGGLNDYVHMKRKPISKPFTFQVERYVGVDGLLVDYLANGTELVLPLVLLVNRYHWNGYPYPTRTYVFTGCTVIGKEYGELNAERSGLLVETTTIAYREMVNVDVGIGANAGETWEYQPKSEEEKEEAEKRRLTHSKRYWAFDDKTYSGKGEGSARHPENEKRKEELLKDRRLWNPDKKKAAESKNSARQPEDYLKIKTEGEGQEKERLWAFDDKKYSGKGEGSARHPENEKRKEELLKDRRLWNPDKKKAAESKNSARQPEDYLKIETEGEGQEKERLWAFDDKTYSGKGEGSARHPENEKRKEELLEDRRLWNPDKKKATESKNSARQPEDYLKIETEGEGQEKERRWAFDAKTYTGKGEMSARHPENEKRKEELLENRRLWDPGQSKGTKSKRSARTVADYLGSREKKASEK